MTTAARTLIWCRSCGACWEGPHRGIAVAQCHPQQQSFVSFYPFERAQARASAASLGADLYKLVTL